MRFWDASAVVPLCIDEGSTSDEIDLLASDGGLVVWWGTAVEVTSAFVRLRRMEGLTEDEELAARDLAAAWRRVWTEVQPSAALREHAMRLLWVHDLRAADALQLSAAVSWAGAEREGSELVCLDERLARAARREGFRVLPRSAAG